MKTATLRARSALALFALLTAIVATSACSTITLRGYPFHSAATNEVAVSLPTPTVQHTQAPPESASVVIPNGATHLKLWIFPGDNEQELLDKISGAKQRVLLTIYLLTDYRFVTALQSAHRNGSDVRVLLDENPYRGTSAARQAFDRLSKAAINVRYSNPQFRFTHQKSMVIDNSAVIMSANLTKSAFSSNRDFAVMYGDSSDVAEMVRTFDADWSRTTVEQNSQLLLWSPTNSRERLSNLINSARRTIDIYSEIAQDDGITDLLAQAAQRKVSVRLVISPQLSTSDDADKPNLDTMQQGGVEVRYLRSPYIHAKMILVDNTLGFIGSQNISATSLEFNRELGVLIADQTVLQRLRQIFQQDWLKAKNR